MEMDFLPELMDLLELILVLAGAGTLRYRGENYGIMGEKTNKINGKE